MAAVIFSCVQGLSCQESSLPTRGDGHRKRERGAVHLCSLALVRICAVRVHCAQGGGVFCRAQQPLVCLDCGTGKYRASRLSCAGPGHVAPWLTPRLRSLQPGGAVAPR